jgi:hypothetical protein
MGGGEEEEEKEEEGKNVARVTSMLSKPRLKRKRERERERERRRKSFIFDQGSSRKMTLFFAHGASIIIQGMPNDQYLIGTFLGKSFSF